MNRVNRKNKIALGTLLAVSSLAPFAGLRAEVAKIPEDCLFPTKVLPEQCVKLPVDICLNYFKERVRDNALISAKEDNSAPEAQFCLKQFHRQLLRDE